jgi:hypothetical protein
VASIEAEAGMISVLLQSMESFQNKLDGSHTSQIGVVIFIHVKVSPNYFLLMSL